MWFIQRHHKGGLHRGSSLGSCVWGANKYGGASDSRISLSDRQSHFGRYHDFGPPINHAVTYSDCEILNGNGFQSALASDSVSSFPHVFSKSPQNEIIPGAIPLRIKISQECGRARPHRIPTPWLLKHTQREAPSRPD